MRIQLQNRYVLALLLTFVATCLIPHEVLAEKTVTYAIGAQGFLQKGGDPCTQMSGFPHMAQNIFDTFVALDKDQNFIPSLAKSWEITKNKEMVFNLRDDLKFHNGLPVTAEDCVYSINQYLRKELRFLFAPLWRRNVESIEATGPYTVKIVLKNPDPGFVPRLWWGTGMFPKKYREEVGDEGFADKPVGTGPFIWKDYKQDSWWEARANKNHFREIPSFDLLRVIYVPDHSTRLAMVKAGEVDIASAIGPQIPQIKSDSNLNLKLGKYPILMCLAFLDLNFPDEKSPFHDIRVREAVSLAIDRKTICDRILFGAAEPYGQYCSPVAYGYDPNAKPEAYDPERAKKLLAEAGYPDGFETTLQLTSPNKYWMEAIKANLEDIGIRGKMEVYEQGAYTSAVFAKKLKGLTYKSLWYHTEKNMAAEASDDFLTYMPWAMVTTEKIHNTVISCMAAETEEEMIACGKKINDEVMESRVRAMLWAVHIPYALGPRIADWTTRTGEIPNAWFSTIKLK